MLRLAALSRLLDEMRKRLAMIKELIDPVLSEDIPGRENE